MANLDKATRLQAHGLIQHDERTIENHTNEKIDPARSHLNYNLQEGDPWQRYCNRMEEVYCLNRKDVKTLAELSVTLPIDVKASDQKAFFESCFRFAQDKFGSENIVSAFVHLDETTPHIHIKAIPVVNDPKKGEKISYKEKCPRSFYQNLHTDLSRHVCADLGYQVSILNGATMEGNKTIKQLKEETLKKQIQEIDRKADQIRESRIEPKKPEKIFGHGEMIDYDSYTKAIDRASILQQENKTLQIENRDLKERNTWLSARVKDWEDSRFGRLLKQLQDQIKELNEQINDLVSKNKYLKNKIEQFRNFDFYKGFYDRTIEEVSKFNNRDDKEWIRENVVPEEYQKQFTKDLQTQERELDRSRSRGHGMSL